MKIEDLSHNASLDRTAMDDVSGGMKFTWRRVKKIRYVFGVKVVCYVWKLTPVYCN